jgi:hypothetical protein
MSFGTAIQIVLRKYAEFNGRATRAEFWWWALFNLLVTGALNLFSVVRIGENAYLGLLLAGLWGIAVLLPSLAVAVRRLARRRLRLGQPVLRPGPDRQESSCSSPSGCSPPSRRRRRRPLRRRSRFKSSKRAGHAIGSSGANLVSIRHEDGCRGSVHLCGQSSGCPAHRRRVRAFHQLGRPARPGARVRCAYRAGELHRY